MDICRLCENRIQCFVALSLRFGSTRFDTTSRAESVLPRTKMSFHRPILIREEERHIHTFNMLQTFLLIGSFFFSFFKSVFVKKASSFQRNSISLHPVPTKARANVTLPRLKSIPGDNSTARFPPPQWFLL